MSGGGEVLPPDFGEESGSGPDPDSGHADQDGVKRVGVDELFGKAGQNRVGRIRAHDDDGLLAEGLGDFGGKATSHPGCPLDQSVPQAERTGGFHRRWGGVFL